MIRTFLLIALLLWALPSSAKRCDTLLAPKTRAHISLDAGITKRQLEAVLRKMDSLGVVAMTEPEAGHDLIAIADSDEFWPRISRLEGVRRVSRPVSGTESFETWKHGRRTGQGLLYGDYTQSERKIWAQMEEPVRGLPPRDLETIRRVARQKGFWIAVDLKRPKDPQAVKDLEEVHGAKLIFPQDITIDSKIVHYPGVVLHLSPDSHALKVRGDINLAIGLGRFYDKLNKVTEYNWVTSVDPNLMSPSVTPRQLYANAGEKFERLRAETMELVRAFVYDPQGWRRYDELKIKLDEYFEKVFRLAKNKYRKGVFFKWAFDYATNESGSIVTGETKPASLAKDYLEYLYYVRPQMAKQPRRLDSPETAELLADSDNSFVMIAHSLLARLDEVLIQRKLDIRKTKNGDLMEFRVDTLYGHALNSSFRMGDDYFPEESKQARAFVQEFLDRLSERDRYVSAGFDVVLLEDGTFSIIETNPSTASSFLDPGSYPASSSKAMSNLLGQPTPARRYLEEFADLPFEQQAAIIRAAPAEPREIKNFTKVPRADILYPYRDHLAAAAVDRKSADQQLKKFRELLKASGQWENYYSRGAYNGLRDYFKRRFG